MQNWANVSFVLCCTAGFQERNIVEDSGTQSRGFGGFPCGFGRSESKFFLVFFVLTGLCGNSIHLVIFSRFACSPRTASIKVKAMKQFLFFSHVMEHGWHL